MFNTITLDGMTIYRPNDFEPKKEYVIKGDYTTCNGGYRGDIVGWKYSDITLSWDSMPQAQLEKLLSLNGEAVELKFTNPSGDLVTEIVVPLTHSEVATRITGPEGTPLWRDIDLELRFVNAHND